MLHRGRSKDRNSLPSPTFMSDDQVADYLTDLRTNRIPRPTFHGARPPPPKQALPIRSSTPTAFQALSSPTSNARPLDNRNYDSGTSPLRSSSAQGHHRRNSSMVSSIISPPQPRSNSRAGRPLVQEPPYPGTVARDFSSPAPPSSPYTPMTATNGLPSPSIDAVLERAEAPAADDSGPRPSAVPQRRSFSPSLKYRESGQRWMERQEARSLRLALEDMDLQDSTRTEGATEAGEETAVEAEIERRVYDAARDEAAELVWRHQNPDAPNVYRNPDLGEETACPAAMASSPSRSTSPSVQLEGSCEPGRFDYRAHLRKGSHARSQSLGPDPAGTGAIPETSVEMPGSASRRVSLIGSLKSRRSASLASSKRSVSSGSSDSGHGGSRCASACSTRVPSDGNARMKMPGSVPEGGEGWAKEDGDEGRHADEGRDGRGRGRQSGARSASSSSSNNSRPTSPAAALVDQIMHNARQRRRSSGGSARSVSNKRKASGASLFRNPDDQIYEEPEPDSPAPKKKAQATGTEPKAAAAASNDMAAPASTTAASSPSTGTAASGSATRAEGHDASPGSPPAPVPGPPQRVAPTPSMAPNAPLQVRRNPFARVQLARESRARQQKEATTAQPVATPNGSANPNPGAEPRKDGTAEVKETTVLPADPAPPATNKDEVKDISNAGASKPSGTAAAVKQTASPVASPIARTSPFARFHRTEIHRNPPSQSRNPAYTSNTPPPSSGSAGSTQSAGPEKVEGKFESDQAEDGTPKMKNGVELRSDDIRAATSMRRRDRSPNLPQPTMVSDSPGRPIVSFQKDWKPKEVELSMAGESASDGSAGGKGTSPRQNPEITAAKRADFGAANANGKPGSRPGSSGSAGSLRGRPRGPAQPVPEINASTSSTPAPPKPSISVDSAPSVPSINVSSAPPKPKAPGPPTINVTPSPPPPVPIISVNSAPSIPTINAPDDAKPKATPPIPSIAVSDDTSNASKPTRPLPNPKSASSPNVRSSRPGPWRPAGAGAAAAPARSNTAASASTTSSMRGGSTALCAACAQPIAGRILAAAGARFHPECFRCHHCSEALECVAFYPEPEGARAARAARIRARARGEDVPADAPGEAEDGADETEVRFFCHLDFHELFSPRCKSCKTPIEGEVVVACGAEWHPFDARTPFVEKEGFAWCVGCHTNRYSAKCKKCRKPVTDTVIKALGSEWHAQCFCCVTCGGQFEDGRYFLRAETMDPVCVRCEEERLKA
ncbi:hypothetical protein BDY21DRAFT_367836 [Lineolata rhizophorae]|uniref:LIM zinc-binding domain-containing protein n=1 Tax=Lineolata rhizophorae TaxID=578093 RepID=A0A6A6NL72_9PEZI|nr:hypothetical protein BDY21DRAFT_367836 [Lineolata rhizophorae]